MYEALIEGTSKIITIDTFKRRYGEKSLENGLKLVCPACKSELHTYALVSLKREPRFHHHPNTSCVYTDGKNNYLAAPNSWDIENGKRIRTALEDKEFISKLYCFCLKLCMSGNLPVDKFIGLVKKADKRNLWSHAGFEEWVIGFLLLVLDDFEGTTREKQKYIFRFSLQKGINRLDESFTKPNSKIEIEDIMEREGYFLAKVFDSGDIMQYPEGNPYPVSRINWQRFSKDYDWTFNNHGAKLVQKIKEFK